MASGFRLIDFSHILANMREFEENAFGGVLEVAFNSYGDVNESRKIVTEILYFQKKKL